MQELEAQCIARCSKVPLQMRSFWSPGTRRTTEEWLSFEFESSECGNLGSPGVLVLLLAFVLAFGELKPELDATIAGPRHFTCSQIRSQEVVFAVGIWLVVLYFCPVRTYVS